MAPPLLIEVGHSHAPASAGHPNQDSDAIRALAGDEPSKCSRGERGATNANDNETVPVVGLLI
jgi:hypothetical protein